MNLRKYRALILLILILPFMGYFEYWNYPYLVQAFPFPASQYRNLIESLKADGYRFILPRDYTGHEQGKVAIIRHDVDIKYNSVLIDVERSEGVRSAFYLRPDGDYFTQSISFFEGLQAQGWEIGFHYDSLSRSSGNFTQAITLFSAQLQYLRMFFNISTVTAHGDNYDANFNDNYLLYANLQNIILSLHVSDFSGLAGATVVQDTDHIWSNPDTKGWLVLVAIHTDWW